MRTPSALLVLTLALPALAAERPLPAFVSPAQRDAVDGIIAEAKKRWTNVFVRVSSFGSSLQVSESSLRLDLNGSRYGNRFDFSGFAGDKHLYFNASPYSSDDPKKGYNLWGGDVNLSMNPSGSDFWVSGTVGQRSMNFNLSRFGGSFMITGFSGASLSVSGFDDSQTISGSVDLTQCDAQCLGVIGAVVGVAARIPK